MKQRKTPLRRALWITQVYPSGLSGTTVKTRRTLEFLLDRKFQIDVCCIHHPKMEMKKLTGKNLHTYVVEKNVMSKFSVPYLLRAFHLLLTLLPFRVKKMYDAGIEQKLKELQQKNQYDYVFFDGFSTLQYAKQFAENHIYIDDEDITDLLMKRYRSSSNVFLKAFFLLEVGKCLMYEKTFLPRMNHIWAISPNTGKRLSAVSGKTAVVMPTIVPSQKNVFSVKAKQVVFTALLSWMENIVGLEWFLETAWPKVRKAVPNAELVVSGQMGDQKLKEYLAKIPGVKLVGFVPSLADLYHNSAVAIAPILINSGIKVKILTYLSFGLPVVSTTQATWGMDSLDGVKAVKETRFADAVIQLLKNPRERQKLSKAGHANIAHHHSDLALTHFFKKVGVLPGREPKK